MKRVMVISATLMVNVAVLPVLSFAASSAERVGGKFVELKTDSHISHVTTELQSLADFKNPELLSTLGRLELPDGTIPGKIMLVVQDDRAGQGPGKIGMVHVQPWLRAADAYRVSPSPSPKTYTPGLVSSRYVRVHGQGVLANLRDYAARVLPVKGLDGLFDRIKEEHAAPLSDDIDLKPELAFDERYVGIAGRFVPIIKRGEQVTFQMGSPEGEEGRAGDEIQHPVTLTRGYKMQATLATWRQVLAVMPELKGKFYSLMEQGLSGLDHPAVDMTEQDNLDFATRVTEILGKWHGYPTETEWEYAARGGMPSGSGFRFFFGDDVRQLAEYAVYSEIPGIYENLSGKTERVATRRLNPYGLDMIGNAWARLSDLYGAYPKEAVTDPNGSQTGLRQVIRGGSWYVFARNLRSANRYHVARNFHDRNIGARLITSTTPIP